MTFQKIWQEKKLIEDLLRPPKMSFGQYKKPTNSGGSGTGNANQTEGLSNYVKSPKLGTEKAMSNDD